MIDCIVALIDPLPGETVQTPANEPASEFLKRLAAQRAAVPKTKRARTGA